MFFSSTVDLIRRWSYNWWKSLKKDQGEGKK